MKNIIGLITITPMTVILLATLWMNIPDMQVWFAWLLGFLSYIGIVGLILIIND